MKISARIAGPINKMLADLFADDGLNCSVTIRQRGITTWNPTLKRNETLEEDFPVTAIRSKHTTRSVEKSGVPGVQVGDSLYLVKIAEIPEGLSSNDVIIHGDQTLQIKGFDDFMFVYSITVAGA